MAMKRTLLALTFATLLHGPALLAQDSTRKLLKPNTTPTVIPVWNVHSGQIEALLVLESEQNVQGRAWVQAPHKNQALPAQKSVGNFTADGSMAIFCAGQQNTFNQLSLLDNCQIGKKSTRYPAINSPDLETKALLQRKGNPLELRLSNLEPKQRRLLATEFDTPYSANGKALKLSPDKSNTGWVSINGNLTRAKLIPASQFPKGLPTEWDNNTFALPERERSLSGEVVGNVVKIPGQDSNIQSIGAGVSWKTPWKGKVSVGAESLLSQGRNSLDDNNPTSPITDQRIDGVRPYVRVEIDL